MMHSKKTFFVITCFLILFCSSTISFAVNGTVIWGNATAGRLIATTYSSPTTTGTAYMTPATSGSVIQFAKIVATFYRDEKFAAHQKADGQLDVLKCIDNCDAAGDWSIIGNLTGSTFPGNATKRAFDIAYEKLSGQAMIVFADDPTVGKVYYCRYNGRC